MTGKKKLIIALIVLAVIAVGAVVIANSGIFTQPTDEGENGIGVNPVPVITIEAFKGSITETTRRVAVVEGSDSVSVVPSIGGRVEMITVRVGDRVTAGQLLVQLEQRDLLAQLAQAEAGLAQAQASLIQAQAGLVQSEAGLVTAEAGMISAVALLDDARATLERMERLYEEGAVSRQQVEQARLQYQLSGLETLEAQIRQAHTGVGQAQTGVGLAQTGVGQAQAGVDIIRNQLEHTIISAPMSGVVTAVNISVGEMAAPSVPLIEIININEVEIPVGVVEQHLSNLRVGDKVDVLISAVRDEPFTGTIRRIAPSADQMTRTFPVTIVLQNENHAISPGMFAEVSLVTDIRQDVVIVPMVAVVDQGGRQTIFVVENGEAISRAIELGINDGQYVELISGIEAGDEIIIRGQNIVNHGVPVMVRDGEEDVLSRGGEQ